MEIKEIRDLIAASRTSDALKKLENFPFTRERRDTFLQLKSRFVELQNSEIKGVLSTLDKDLKRNNLINDLLIFLSTLEINHSIINDITPLRLDVFFTNDYKLDELELFLHEFETNLENEIDFTNFIIFQFEEMLIEKMEADDNKLMRSRIKNVLSIFNEYKEDLVQNIKILLTNKQIYYKLNDDKQKQTIVLRSILERFRCEKRSKILELTTKKGITSDDLIKMMLSFREKPNITYTDFLNESNSTDTHNIDIYNNKTNPKVSYSIRLTNEEFIELKNWLNNFGEKDYLYHFMGQNSIEATRLSEKLIFERAIPKSIFDSYYKLKDKRMTRDSFKVHIFAKRYYNAYIKYDCSN